MNTSIYNVYYLGWKVSPSIGCREHIEPIVKDIIKDQKVTLAALTLEISKDELNIIQINNNTRTNHPTIQCKDITFVMQLRSPNRHVIACVFLGYNPSTGQMAHIHVYKCINESIASNISSKLSSIVSLPENRRRADSFERKLVQDNRIIARPGVTNRKNVYVDLTSELDEIPPPFSSLDQKRSDLKYHNICDEFHHLLKDKSSTPILLPAKDYDTPIKSNSEWKCQNIDLIGNNKNDKTVINIKRNGTTEVSREKIRTKKVTNQNNSKLHSQTSYDIVDSNRNNGIRYAGTGDDVPIDYLNY